MQDIIGAPQMHTVAGAGASISRFREPETLPCSMVNNLAKNTEDQCKFIMDNDCLEDEATVDYVYLVFCKIDYDLRLVAITLVIFLVIVLFLNLSAVADEFLCPSLLTVAKNLRMSDSLAGVTLLAFGNGCPDIFSSLAAASSGRPELIVGELLGAGIFCTSIVAGLIFITTEFKIARRPLLRDTSFYLLAVYLIWLYCTQGQVTFYGALAFIIIYVIYLLTALVGQAVHSRLRGEYPVVEMGPANEKKAPARGALDEEEQEASATEKEIIYRRLEELMRRRSSGLMEFKPLDGKRNHDNQNNTSSIHNNNSSIASQMDTVTTIYIGSTSDDSLPSYGRRNGREDTDRRILSRDWNNNNVIEGEPAEQEHGTRRTSLKSTASPVSEAMSDSKLSEIKLTAGTLLNDDSMALFESPTNINKRRSLAEQAANDNNSRFNLDEFDNFLAQVNPIDTVDWSRLSLITKIMALLRAPLLLLTILTVPVVDGEKPNSNWCRLLNSIHCFTIPIAVITLTRLMGPNWWFGDSMGPAGELEQFNQADEQLQRMAANLSDNLSSGGEYNNGHGSNGNDSDTVAMVGAHSSLGGQTSDLEDMLNSTYSRHLILLPGLVLALYVFLTTNAKRPPRYHSLFAYFGFIMSVLWIYKLANEIISLLKTIGIIFSMSDTAIGLGFLAWGNSLGDIVANLTLAQAGYARMALGASIGAPLLNLLLGFGLAFTISLRPGESTEIDYNDTMTLLAGTLALILVLLMASTFLAQNRSKKAFGYILIACYCLYFLLAVCLECDFL